MPTAPGRASGPGPARPRLNRDHVLAAAVALADREGVEALSMRRLAADLGVVPMALYKHVRDKEDLLDGVVDALVGEIEDTVATPAPEGWRPALRARVLAARRVLLRHPWARQVLEQRPRMTPAALGYVDGTIAILRAGGFGDDLTHHVMHALGSRVWGFTQELFDRPPAPGAAPEPPPDPAVLAAMAQRFPNVAAIARTARHEDGSVVARGCDDQAEFEFALDLVLDGIARLRDVPWSPPVSTG